MKLLPFHMLLGVGFAYLSGCATTGSSSAPSEKNVDLVIFHNNDGESQLTNAGTGLEEFGGISRFTTKLRQLRAAVPAQAGHLLLSSGDNILPGPELRVSLDRGKPFIDALVINKLNYDALCLGNHDFDLGPDVLADFIDGTRPEIKFLSANLDFSEEPKLNELRNKGRIQRSTIVEASNGTKVGVIGIVTPRLPSISAPRKVKVQDALRQIVQAEVDKLEKQGIKIIVLLSHLQDISIEVELIKSISGVDVVIAGGGDELLTNDKTTLVPGDEKSIRGPYPLLVNNKGGQRVPVVTTAGSYRYIGELALRFTPEGNLKQVLPSSRIHRIASTAHAGGVEDDAECLTEIMTPLTEGMAAIAKREIARTDTPLEGRRNFVRSRETNLGNLVADAFLWYARNHASEHNQSPPQVAFVNGGAIRNDSVIPKGGISELDVQKIVPLPGFVALVSEVPVRRLKEVLEYSFAKIGGGGFLQVSGLKVKYDAKRSENRVRMVKLDGGQVLVKDGELTGELDTINLATLSFLARGGGNIPLKGLDAMNFAADYKKALQEYLNHLTLVTKQRYRNGKPSRLIPTK